MIRLHSVRARLTLLNVVVLALILALLGALLRFTLQQTLLAGVDAHLRQLIAPIVRSVVDDERDQLPPPLRDRPDANPPWRPDGELGDMRNDGPPPNQDRRFGAGEQPPAPLPPPQRPRSPWDQGPQDEVGDGPPDMPFPHRLRPHDHTPHGVYPPRLFRVDDNTVDGGDRGDSRPYDHELYELSLHGEDRFGETNFDNVQLRVYSTPITLHGRIIAVAQAVQPLTDVNKGVAQLTRILLLVSPIALLIAGLSGLLLANRALRPVRQLIKAAERIEASDLAGRIPVEGRDEFAELSRTINSMFARLEKAFAKQEEAIRHLRQFTADASHELRTPLTIIKANTSLALTSPDDTESLRTALQEADWAADRMNAIVQDLLLLARSDSGTIEMTMSIVPVVDLIEQAVRLVSKPDTASIEVGQIDKDWKIAVDRGAIERLLGNLIRNAQRHTPQDGRIAISVRIESSNLLITVADNGEGIAAEHLPNVFDRFYRVDSARSRGHGGTGLGLSICKTIAEAHDGKITISSILGIGTQVTVQLPMSSTGS